MSLAHKDGGCFDDCWVREPAIAGCVVKRRGPQKVVGEETRHSLVHFLSTNMSVCRVLFATLRRFESTANLGLFNSSPETKPRERLVSLHRAGYWVAAAQLRVSRSATHHSFSTKSSQHCF